MTRLTEMPEWQALAQHLEELQDTYIIDLFEDDASRFERYSGRAGSLFIDYSKNLLTDETRDLLMSLARACQLEQWRDRMFAGELINFTEQRAVLHVALRNTTGREIRVEGENVMPAVQAELEHMREFSDRVRNGSWQGHTGKTITDIVNIGIGGSDLGPRMVINALQPYVREDLSVHFVANVDASEITEVLKPLNPETTLFVIASKSFTTQDTLVNARTAREWLLNSGADHAAVAKHFVAVSVNEKAVTEFGIDSSNMFRFWDWVGGRYSLWSAIGLPIMLGIGKEAFEELLQGAHEMDEHFRTAPLEQNLPVIMGLTGVWYYNFFGADTQAILPYDYYLRDLPRYLQQADMESNGKCITRDDEEVDYTTGPVIFGETGVNGQHAFYQLIHQGTLFIPSDFIIPVESQNPTGEHHNILTANCLAQTEALLKGKTEAEVRAEMQAAGVSVDMIELLAKHRTFPGNQPTTTILIDKLTPKALGNLVALYEHKIFVQGIIWNINSYDQWGVELGKVLAKTILSELQAGQAVSSHDQSTNGLINQVLKK